MSVAPFVFFALGIPAAVLIDRLISRLTAYEAEEGVGRKRLPWQNGPREAGLRVAAVCFVPPLMAATAMRFNLMEALAASLLLISFLVCATTDLLRYRVPNTITYPGIGLSLIAAIVMPRGDFTSAAVAAVLSALVFVAVWALSRGGIGLADVKFAVLIGAALGLPAAYPALATGVVIGGVVMAALLVAGVVSRRQVTPYAPFLALSSTTVVLVQGTAFAPL